MIYFETWAGLCNRLRGMSSAYGFAKEIGIPLTVIWENLDICNCSFDDYFELDVDQTIPVKVCNFNMMGTSLFHKALHFLYNRKIASMKKKSVIISQDELMKMDLEELKKLALKKDVYIRSYYYWYEWDNPYSIFKIKPCIENKVNQLMERCGKDAVGVHIRRTDHDICISESPTEVFINEMRKEPDEVCFFVATDELTEREKLIREFGKERIIFNEDAELSRASEKGMEDAVVDLYALSRTNKILGSSTSSFTEMAAKISEIPLLYCMKE